MPEENDGIAQQRVGEVHGTDIHEEMRRSYLDYAMSVIIGRALPDVRDGLKPVHRRVLYAMDEMGLHHNRPHRKAARVVGDVLGKYHPHGDTAVYDTIVRLVQDFSMRYPLIDGQGNFGSVDGDAPAAMRYTEVRLARLAQVILQDINKETVDFVPNYDESTQEPVVLPALMPNLLVNGSSGIAVGMATNIPPHNLSEVVDAVVAQLENPEITIAELMQSVPGPDFPTAGYIHGRQGISDAYRTGRGLIQVRAKAFVEKGRAGRENILVTELPYQVNKAKLVERIAELVRGKKIEGVADLRDESDREGMRIVLELKKDEPAMPILNSLYKHTAMQSTFGVIMLALVDNQPRILDLKQVIGHFIDHRKVVVVRRTRYELRQAEARAHILEGYRIALDHLDAVIQLIRRSRAADEARSGLMREFGMTETQAQAVLDLTLRRLTQLERQKIQDEYQETIQLIAKLQAILGSEALVRQIIKEELGDLKEEYGDPRRTQILEETAEISYEDTLADDEMVVTISHGGYIKRSPLTIYRAQRRGGKGTTGMVTKEEDYVEHLFVATTHSYILLFTNLGRVHWLKVHEVPQLGRAAKGKALVNFLQVQPGEMVTAMIPIRQFEIGRHLFMATRRGVVKKTELHAYSNPRVGGIIAITLDEGDELIAVRLTGGRDEIFLATKQGMAIRFNEEAVRAIGRAGRGVIGIALEAGDEVVAGEIVRTSTTVLTVNERGYGKRTELEEYRLQGRGGEGIINVRVSEKNGPVVGALQVQEQDQVMMISQEGKVNRVNVREIGVIGRATLGVRLQGLETTDRVAAVTGLVPDEGDGEANTNGDDAEPAEPEA
ncbi:MAG: DNA gyrase subunit A [candidate division NC10 bacterium]